MSVDVFLEPWIETISCLVNIGLLVAILGFGFIFTAFVTPRLLDYFRSKAKPKRTGEKLKRGDGAVMDVITDEHGDGEKTKNS